MPFLDHVKTRIGNDVYLRLESEAEKEVALAMEMPLHGKNHQQLFYTQRGLLGKLLAECELFESRGMKILPTDVVTLLFRCKLLFATPTDKEYRQRSGGGSPFEHPPTRIQWSQRSQKIEAVIEQTFEYLERDIEERTLVAQLNSYTSATPADGALIQQFLDELFKSLSPSLQAFVAADKLIEGHRALEPRLTNRDANAASEFFQAPSVGYTVRGSRGYCRWTSMHWLRTFLNVLRVGSFVHPGQIQFGGWEVRVTAPTSPVFVGGHSIGCFVWEEDKKESWAKIPDGSLFLSFGYRGFSPMWLDRRTSLSSHSL